MSSRRTIQPKRRMRNGKPRAAKSRVPRGPSLGRPVSFRQTAYSLTLTQTNSDVLGGTNFVLSSASNYTGFTDLWDVYRVDYLEFSFEPMYTANSVVDSTMASIPRIFTVVDLDDAIAAGSIGALREYQSCQTHLTEHFRIRFRPGVLTGIFDGSNVVAGTHTLSPWIDCSKISIPHYGLKYGIEANTVGSATRFQSWNVTCTVGLTFKYVR